MPMNTFPPKHIRYIKLGSGGHWAQHSLANSEMHFGFETVPDDLCKRGDWDAVANLLQAEGRIKGKARDNTREIRDFLLRRSLPVDIRHNAKIFREKLVPWASARLS